MNNFKSPTQALDDGQPLVEVAGVASPKLATFDRHSSAILQSNVGVRVVGAVLQSNIG